MSLPLRTSSADEKLALTSYKGIRPASLIAQNAGVEGEVVVEKVKDAEWEIGYNAMTDKYENLVEAGVIDPAKEFLSAFEMNIDAEGWLLMEKVSVGPR
ncbi:Chaperonin 60 subunit alpha 1, chloroplastic [Datura stramonium]|uniref:Chaperonin 60 subunit alpha 1, chloroplastic n=1 Tax=Datura stramonium TaxID=4076 RepID=A0ABS8TET6_DATST|nr:Chaperonin 60 subunit alpha 1, chloroplastic [Datura stramonium]